MAHSKFTLFGLLLGTSLIMLALPAAAEEPAGNIPPRAPEISPIPAQPPEIMIEPQASSSAAVPAPVIDSAGCTKIDGFVENAGSLPAIYKTGILRSVELAANQNEDLNDDEPWTTGIENGGTLQMNGISYPLVAIQVDPGPAFPLSSVRYEISFNFVHKSQNGETIIVQVPAKQGAGNMGAYNIIGSANMEFDPNSLMPVDRSFALIGETAGAACAPAQKVRRYMLMTPIEISPEQVENLSTQC